MRRFHPLELPGTLGAAAACLVLHAAACGGAPVTPPDGGGADRETFIATYVDLRAAVIRAEAHELSEADRAAILQRHGVTEADMMAFAETHGADVAFMRRVWDEIEARLDAERFLPQGGGPS